MLRLAGGGAGLCFELSASPLRSAATQSHDMSLTRRQFLERAARGASALSAVGLMQPAVAMVPSEPALGAADLPHGRAPAPAPLPHFPSRLHAFVWRNWPLVPVDRLARVVGAKPADIVRLGRAMGLSGPPRIPSDLRRRSALTVIRRNWHLLPYEQLLALLGWTPEQMSFALREDDFLYVKLGNLKPRCEPIRYAAPTAKTIEAEAALAQVVRAEFPDGVGRSDDPLFGFVGRLSARPPQAEVPDRGARNAFSPRFCYSYFALYGDPLLEPAVDPYPAGYLARLAAAGVDGVWLQAVLYKLAPFPWEPGRSARYAERLKNLGRLVRRARQHGMGVWLYLNEPRAMSLAFYAQRAELKGVVEGDHAALCSSHPAVRAYLREAMASICRAVPDLAGFFTISGSENLTNCWSHGSGAGCPRCAQRSPAEVIAELHGALHDGIRDAGVATRLVAWDWGWADAWVPQIIDRLPTEVSLMSVSEWSIPIQRGGIATTVGEYSISTVGPGPRARRHWELARKRGLRTLAKIQAGNTWELSAVPYIPAVANVARHAANLREAGLNGLMLGWTLGGYPSPNLEVVAAVARNGATGERLSPEQAMLQVAERRFGTVLAPRVVQAWRDFSAAFSEFPFHGGVVYNAPMQYGPSNLLWGEPTGYAATMVGFPYDDLDGWRQVYPVEVFIGQFQKVADGFDRALGILRAEVEPSGGALTPAQRAAVAEELSVAEAAAIHFRSTANQARFVAARQALVAATSDTEARSQSQAIARVLRNEIELAKRLHALQCRDSRLGFEASNQYYYVPVDLAEKVINAHDLLERWLPAQRGWK